MYIYIYIYLRALIIVFLKLLDVKFYMRFFIINITLKKTKNIKINVINVLLFEAKT